MAGKIEDAAKTAGVLTGVAVLVAIITETIIKIGDDVIAGYGSELTVCTQEGGAVLLEADADATSLCNAAAERYSSWMEGAMRTRFWNTHPNRNKWTNNWYSQEQSRCMSLIG